MTIDPAHDPLVRRHAVAWGVVALGLVTIVAMAAHGSTWSNDGGGEVRSLPHVVGLAAVVVCFVVAALLLLLSLGRAGRRETPEQRRQRWITAIGFIALLAVISLFRGLLHPSDGAEQTESRPVATNANPTSGTGSNDGGSASTWWPLVIVGLGGAAAIVAATSRRRAAPATDNEIDVATIALLDASLDDLRREPDARRAVVAAYARMERGLAAFGFARESSETPTEYFDRAVRVGTEGALASHPVAVQALGELTALAERARFSTLPVDESMRARAVDALEHLRAALRPSVDTRPVDSALDRDELGRVV